MPDPLLLLLVVPSVLVTATLSGVFGMAGGILLMAVYGSFLPVPAAMVLHGVTQAASNGSRFLLLRRSVRWRCLPPYLAGVALAVAAALVFRVVPDRSGLYLALGLISLAAVVLPPRAGLDVERPAAAVGCGAVVTAAQLTAGVSGPLLDVFFVRSSLDRHGIVGTKAVTQTLGHLLKLLFFAAVACGGAGTALPWWIFPAAVAAALAGTAIGRCLLDRMPEGRFRRASRVLIGALSVVCLLRAAA